MTLLRIRHVTRYRYDEPVRYGLQQLRVTPKSRAGQKVLDWDVTVEGGRIETAFDDSHANRVQLASVDEGATEVAIVAEGRVEATDGSGVIGAHGGYMPLWMFLRPTDRTRAGNGVRRLAGQAREAGGDGALDRLHALSATIRDAIPYATGSTHVGMSAEEAVDHGTGVCQDHAHVFVAACRFMDVPARYVSGYLMMDDRVAQDATHAWAEAHVHGLGWVGFDVSNGISPDGRYVRVATALDYAAAAPVTGMRQGAGAERLDVSVEVEQQRQQQQSMNGMTQSQGDGGQSQG
ncbi:transglutaminase family protein [Jannaschia sp. Os4]|uniref:transglutaminase family protein n=1 Tax=Jannaschia sp. Os4 TaxID=2807617 RepID=UPI001939DDCC|nr:transglutaminase family protein [Jannaschia sp. Os4]MBM2574883.1 transglutaminase family protein [Jannaschia sp. Os4]